MVLNMFLEFLLFSSICGLVRSSAVAVPPLAPAAAGLIAPAPVVTAASSQYFQRTFNRLVLPPVGAPVAPIAPPALVPIAPVAPRPTVFVNPTNTVPVVLNPAPPQELPVQPNVAVAIATAQAAPVATILLPPYPFGFPPGYGFVPSEQPTNVADENTREPTTQRTTVTETTTTAEPESTTPIDTSSSDNSFVQALPSNDNVNFKLYGIPSQESKPQFPPAPQPNQPRPQFRPQLPNPNFKSPKGPFRPQSPNPQFSPQPQIPQFRPQQPQFRPEQPQFRPQQPQFRPEQPQFRPEQPQFRPQQPQFHQQPQQSQFQPQHSQFQPQKPEFPPYPPHQKPQPEFQPLPSPQPQLRPQFQPKPQTSWPSAKPQKFKTSVEIVPVPLVYITPPPLHKTHGHVKVVKHIYSYVPATSAKIILKPIKHRKVRLVKHKLVALNPQKLQAIDRDIEVTTFNPFPRPNTKPPRV